jgi:hypothetical protein
MEGAERTKKANRIAHGDGNTSVKEYRPARKGRIVAEIE